MEGEQRMLVREADEEARTCISLDFVTRMGTDETGAKECDRAG